MSNDYEREGDRDEHGRARKSWRASEREAAKRNRPSLTVKTMEAARPEAKEYTLYHKDGRGLGLRVRHTGEKTFYFYYSTTRGKRVKKKIGSANAMTLENAKSAAQELWNLVSEGEDPRELAKDGKNLTFGVVFKEYYLSHAKGFAPKWRRQVERLYERFFEEELAETPIGILRRVDLMRCLEHAPTSNMKSQAHRAISSVLSWCVDMGYIERNPIKQMQLGHRLKSRDRVLSDKEIASIWHATSVLRTPFPEFVQMLILTGQRRSEVSEMKWAEINFEESLWRLPKGRTKNGYAQEVPLTPTMISVLDSLPKQQDYVFASPTVEGRPIGGFSKPVRKLRDAQGIEHWVLHDLRRSLASGMARLGVQPHVIEAVIGHRTGAVSGLAAIYNRHTYEDEKREALMLWDQHIQEILQKYPEIIPPKDDAVVL